MIFSLFLYAKVCIHDISDCGVMLLRRLRRFVAGVHLAIPKFSYKKICTRSLRFKFSIQNYEELATSTSCYKSKLTDLKTDNGTIDDPEHSKS